MALKCPLTTEKRNQTNTANPHIQTQWPCSISWPCKFPNIKWKHTKNKSGYINLWKQLSHSIPQMLPCNLYTRASNKKGGRRKVWRERENLCFYLTKVITLCFLQLIAKERRNKYMCLSVAWGVWEYPATIHDIKIFVHHQDLKDSCLSIGCQSNYINHQQWCSFGSEKW